LEVDVSVEGSYSGDFEAKFSASTDYKSVSEGTTKNKQVITSSKAECAVYDGSLSTYVMPAFNDNFLGGV
jgi:hypothetical protein